jgi:hypothetical protein
LVSLSGAPGAVYKRRVTGALSRTQRIAVMKFTIEVECTPEEARRFVGLPDVTPINDMLVKEMGDRMQANIQMLAPDQMLKSWMSVGTQAQDAFLKLMQTGTQSALKTMTGE